MEQLYGRWLTEALVRTIKLIMAILSKDGLLVDIIVLSASCNCCNYCINTRTAPAVPGILNLYELRPHMWVVHKEHVETAFILGISSSSAFGLLLANIRFGHNYHSAIAAESPAKHLCQDQRLEIQWRKIS
jgi:hypothetical protein